MRLDVYVLTVPYGTISRNEEFWRRVYEQAVDVGTYDLLIETVCEDNEALLRFLTAKLRAIDGVRETETFVYLRMVKQTYQWGTR